MIQRLPRRHDRRMMQRHGHAPVLGGVVLALATLLTVAGCGATSGAANGSHGSTTATPGSPGIGKLTVRGCPGPLGTANDAGTPALVLTNQRKSGNAHVGDLIQVQVPATYRWTHIDASSNLALQQPAGIQDSSRNVCVWTYRALGAGAASVSLVGGALCEPMQPCPAYAVAANFMISIK